MALYPAPDMRSGAVSLWVAGDEQAERAAELVRELGHTVASSATASEPMATRFDPAGPLRGSLRPPADKSISHRAALIAAMGEGETDDRGLPRLRRHPLDPGRGARRSAPRSRASTPGRRSRRDARSAASACAAPAAAAIDVGNAGTLLRLLPGWLAGQPGGRWTLDGDESIRRRPVDRIAEPLRLMGARLECREDRLPPLRIEARAAAAASSTSCRSPAPR